VSATEKIPVVCFPHAGAGKLYYSKWRFSFNDGIDLRIVQYPLREQRMSTPMPASLLSLAEDIFAEFADAFRGPYAIWGHSMGSVVGYEVAKLCQERLGNPPLVFFSSGSSAPCDSRFTSVADLDTREGFNNVLRRYGGVSEQNLQDADFMKYFAPIIGADLRLLGTYEETTFAKLRCPMVLMEGRDDAVTTDKWALYTDYPLELTEFDGGHFFLDEHRTTMASQMGSRVHREWQRATSSAAAVHGGHGDRLLRGLR
jgi:surfactin synthase thioesterase subunit